MERSLYRVVVIVLFVVSVMLLFALLDVIPLVICNYRIKAKEQSQLVVNTVTHGSVAGLTDSGWIVEAEYNGLPIVAACATKDEANRLYAVLAGKMIGR